MNITIPSIIVLAAVVALVFFHEQDKPVAAPAQTKTVERLVFRPKVIVKTVETKVETFVDRVIERKSAPFPETKVAAFAYPQAVMPSYVPIPHARPRHHHVGHTVPRAWHLWPQCACDAKWSNS